MALFDEAIRISSRISSRYIENVEFVDHSSKLSSSNYHPKGKTLRQHVPLCAIVGISNNEVRQQKNVRLKSIRPN